MKKSKRLSVVAGALSLSVVLAACGSGDQAPKENEGHQDQEQAVGEPQEGGQITAAMYSAPDHQFNPIFYRSSYDANILDFTHEALVGQDAELNYIPRLAKEWEFNEDQTELTYFLNEGVKWHDGEEFTADDVVFTFTSIADGDYTAAGGVRVDYVSNLVGYEEYRDGEAETLAGVEAIDEYTVKFTFKEPNVTALYNTSFPIIPEHVFGEIPVAEMPNHPASRNAGEVIGTGPFKLTQYQDGEQYILERHEDYWQGKPYLERIVWRVIDQAIMTGMLSNNELDLVTQPSGVAPADASDVEALDNVVVEERQDLAYQYLGFKLHHSDDEKKWNDPSTWRVNEKVADVNVRQAIAHAIERENMVNGLLYGRGTVIDAPFPEASWAFNPDAATHYEYSVDKANALLDEAGYVDANGDGFREDPNGNEWTLNMDYPTGNQVRERSAPIIKENLEAVGIRVNLRNPREASGHFEVLETNNTDWDLYLAGWSLASGDVDPGGIHRSTAPYNYLRWLNEESDALIDKGMQAPEAFDIDFRKQVYADWAKLYSEEVPAVILYSQNVVHAWNERLQGIEVKAHTLKDGSHLWWVKQ